MDRLNLENLVLVWRALARADFPEASDPATTGGTVVRQRGGALDLAMEPVHFPHVRPGVPSSTRPPEEA